MTFLNAPLGGFAATRAILADTSAANVVVADRRIAIALIRVANTTGSAVDATISITDGSSTWHLTLEEPIAAYGRLEIRDEILEEGDTLKVTAGTGSGALHVHVIHSLPDRAGRA